MKLSPRTLAIRRFSIEISRLLLIRTPHGKTDGSEVDRPQYIADLSRLTMLPQYSDLVIDFSHHQSTLDSQILEKPDGF